MAYRSCDDCMFNRGYCMLGHEETFDNDYDENQCDDGTGNIYLEEDDYYGDEDDDW